MLDKNVIFILFHLSIQGMCPWKFWPTKLVSDP